MSPRLAQAMLLASQNVQKYARRDSFFSRLLRNPRRLADFLRTTVNHFTTRPVSEREMQRAMETAREELSKTQRPGWDSDDLPRADLIARRALGLDDGESERTILTPNSSNVYGFAYSVESRTRGTLYVTYRHGKATSKKKRRNSCTGEEYKVGNKPNVAGPTYAYFDVPMTVFNRLKSAQSKGGEIWQSLRICGSVYGHQYRYTLVAGAQVGPNFGDVYVPRRATQAGFQKRAVRLTGRNQFVSSTLQPERRRFTGADNDVYRSAVRRFRGNR